MKISKYIILVAIVFFGLFACNDGNDNVSFPKAKEYDMTGFAKGADVSWLTEMEKSGALFYDSLGHQQECMHILRDLGVNSIRLRVWVNPSDGWCNASDVLVKAIRAKDLGMRVMIDFHYSDTWADPANQTKPAAWQNLSFADLETALATHTKDVLNKLKDNGVDVEWVQVGNETHNGMLWDDGKASTNMENYADLTTAGYNAVKEVYPNAKVIVHIDNGYDNSLYRWIFDGLTEYGAKYDVIGMSLYPDSTNWRSRNQDCLANMNDMISRYGKEVMICEAGFAASQADSAKAFLSDLMVKAKSVPNGKCLGIFYWEPEAYASWKGYKLGAFDDNGKPTVALDAFK